MYKVRVCFEIAASAHLAVDEQGKPDTAGAEIYLGESLKEWPYEELTANIDLAYMADLLHVSVEALKLITPEEYDERYGGGE